MSEFKVASRYAKALLDLARERQIVEEVRSDMDAVASVLKGNSELLAVLSNPIVAPKKKKDILLAIFDGKVQQLVIGFFKIMADKGRASILYGTAKEFEREYNVFHHIITASVTSAVELSETVKADLVKQISEAYAGKVQLENKIDPELIGGFILHIGDKQIDASISGKLNRLSRSFQGGN